MSDLLLAYGNTVMTLRSVPRWGSGQISGGHRSSRRHCHRWQTDDPLPAILPTATPFVYTLLRLTYDCYPRRRAIIFSTTPPIVVVNTSSEMSLSSFEQSAGEKVWGSARRAQCGAKAFGPVMPPLPTSLAT